MQHINSMRATCCFNFPNTHKT